MKRVFFLFSLLVSFALVFSLFGLTGITQAKVACPSSEMECPTLDNQGGCQSPCVRALTQSGGPGGRGVPLTAKCACVIPEEPESRACGEPCNTDSECPSDCSVCTPTSFHSVPVCATKQWQTGNPALNINVRAQECDTNIVTIPGDYESDPIMAKGIKTALGCIPYDPGPLVTWIFGVAISIGGGVAFLIMGVGAFLFITSQGNPEQLQKGKEMIVSAGAGLLFIIFSIFLLRLIGVDILKIPGFQ